VSVAPFPPRATYRLQLRQGVDLRAAARLIPYLDRLGVSHLYLSPIQRACTGSVHGYDGVDPTRLDPALGEEADLEALAAGLHARGMGLLLDIVPNHLAVGRENPWWWDVLEFGQASRYADFFDIDWESVQRGLRGKVLVPILGAPYGVCLEGGELRLRLEPGVGRIELAYHEHRLPLAPASYAAALGGDAAAEPLRPLVAAARESDTPSGGRRLQAELAGRLARAPDLAAAIEAGFAGLGAIGLHQLLEAQHWRIAHWRTARDELNYRSFFDVAELVSLRAERSEVFEASHRRVLDWVRTGLVDGLRIDHLDGLRDPQAYLERLRAALGGRHIYLVVEKVLASGERLPRSWPVEGTTGYEFLNLVQGLLVDGNGARGLERAYRQVVRGAPAFGDVSYASQLHVLRFLLRGQLRALARELAGLAARDWHTRDLGVEVLAEALAEIVACLRVYRTYVREDGASDRDRRQVARAAREARRRNPRLLPDAVRFVERAWTDALDCPKLRPRALDLALRIQQLTGPVQAKGLEDTSFYRHHRLVSLNEVGGDPRRFGVSPEGFHLAGAERARRLPHAMLATATHDTKRGEDVRARLAVLSEVPEEWERLVLDFVRRSRPLKRRVARRLAPTSSDEYLLYQTLVGTWPAEGLPGGSALESYRERIEAYARKAVRESKEVSSWRFPDPAYEEAMVGFVGDLLEGTHSEPFRRALEAFVLRVAPAGAANGLAQVVLKLTVPGVPDVYQGCELWDHALVDPDNRRPVDFEARARALGALDPEPARAPDPALAKLAGGWRDGLLKLLVTARLLRLRRAEPALFAGRSYLPLPSRGARARHVLGFVRQGGGRRLLVATARCTARLQAPAGALPVAEAFEDAMLEAPEALGAARWRDVLSGLRHETRAGGAPLAAASLFAALPVAVLVDEEDAG
jgi:(1->4)-alpha-D-glucan 1-alpha-D-glucosylmutase